ncbi:hypothetical protein [Asticcacaulis sp.]|uniref:hypothetical protein n=1 Tax=Asticcacaulis sp. TaxID=1872648 RepID=UPI0026179EFC|nr:hypothetical protein [Asticcacaulis sp.]
MPYNDRGYLQPTGDNGDVILRIPRDDAAHIVERLRETRAAELRRAFAIDLAPLRDALGERWTRKQPLILDFVNTTFNRRHPEPNWCVPLSDEIFLCVIPTIGENAGARAVDALRQTVVDHFVGTIDASRTLYWASVTDTDRLHLHALNPDVFFDRGDGRIASEVSTPPLPSSAEDAGSSVKGVYWQVPDTPYRMFCTLEPLFEMRKLMVIGHRLKSIVLPIDSQVALEPKQVAALDWSLRERIDIANLQSGVNQLRLKPPEQRRMVMVVPAAFSTFSSARGRARMISEVSAACRDLGLRCIFEVRDIDGVPQGRMSEVVTLLRPFSMTCIGNVRANPKSISVVKDCGLGGVSVSIDTRDTDDEALETQLSELSAAARSTTGACMVEGFQTLRQLAVAKAAGISHASLRSHTVLPAQ